MFSSSRRDNRREVDALVRQGHSRKEIESIGLKKWKAVQERILQYESEIKSKEEKLKAEEVRREQDAREEEQRQVAIKIRNDEIQREKMDEYERRRGYVMDKTEISNEKIDFTQGSMGLVDRMECHQAGSFLKNVVISNRPPPDREVNLARLRTYQPGNDIKKLSLGDIQPIDLSDKYVEFPITNAMTTEQLNGLKPYCLVSDVFIHYVPLDTFFTTSAPVIFCLNDFRKFEDTSIRMYPLTHSGGYNILFSLDFCVRKEDLHCLSLSISTGLSTFRPGMTWGTVKIVVTLTHMDFPVKANMQETMGVLHMADSDLKEYISDPRSSDGVITPQALKLLKQFYARGDIENVMKPKDDTKEVNTARTEFVKNDLSVDVRDLMSTMRENALKTQREKEGITLSRGNMDIGDPVLHDNSSKAQKVNKSSHLRSMSGDTLNQDEVNHSSLNEVCPNDSLSNAGSEVSSEHSAAFKPPKGNLRSVRFGD